MKAKKWSSWKSEEDRVLIQCVSEAIEQGNSYTSAFKKASKIIGRTLDGCDNRWKKLKEERGDKLIQKNTTEEDKQSTKSSSTTARKLSIVTPGGLFSQTTNREIMDYQKSTASNVPQKDTMPWGNEDVCVDSPPPTKFEVLLQSIEEAVQTDLKILSSGVGSDYIVLQEDVGYVVTVSGNKVTGCNCRYQDKYVCRHMVKVALTKKLEVF